MPLMVVDAFPHLLRDGLAVQDLSVERSEIATESSNR
jgi:hypothetical protein